MADPGLQLGRDPTFERFLSSNVGEDERGANVTVLSMLARLGVDPWEEASTLAAMADNPARKRLGALMSRFKDVSSPTSGSHKIVSDLLVFLPKEKPAARPVANGDFTRFALPPIGAPIYWIVAAATVLAWFAVIALSH